MDRDANPVGAQPRTLLSVPDGIFLTVGMIIGALIFKAPSTVAASTSSVAEFLLAWVLGGAASLCGALVYGELVARHPETGGEYTFLHRAMGRGVAFLFAWSRMIVIQTGAIAAVAFVFGEYASEIFRLGDASAAVWAAIAVTVLTLLNLAGTLTSKTLQKTMEAALIAGLIAFSIAALAIGGTPRPAQAGTEGTLGFAMIFVLLAYSGWNEAAYLGGELRDSRKNMTRVLMVGVLSVTALYLLVNVAYLYVLGHGGVRESKAVAADVMRAIAGDRGAVLLALIVCVSVLTTINAAIFTGARTNYAFGRDFRLFGLLGTWRERGSTPANALVVQGVITLALIGAGSATPDGFNAMVAYTSPVFWTFFLMTGLTLFVFRARGGDAPVFRVPLYPVIPVAFCATCAYMLYSSVNYARFAVAFGPLVLAGIVFMAAGIPLYLWSRHRQ